MHLVDFQRNGFQSGRHVAGDYDGRVGYVRSVTLDAEHRRSHETDGPGEVPRSSARVGEGPDGLEERLFVVVARQIPCHE